MQTKGSEHHPDARKAETKADSKAGKTHAGRRSRSRRQIEEAVLAASAADSEKAALRSRFFFGAAAQAFAPRTSRMSRTETSDVPSLSSWNSSVALSSLVSVA